MSDKNHDHSEHDHELLVSASHAHREAAHHFELAAKHHLLAADADEKDDVETAAHQAYIAYGHALHGKLFAEEAACEQIAADEDDEDHGHEEHTDHSHDQHGHSDKH
ncbi:MAG: hypothetical protein DVB28_000671 [Verrucomicrobia bacterium]|nr:MAG: hypothetical protein DVB28_000671 [Verrucomicrobiota bacterium]